MNKTSRLRRVNIALIYSKKKTKYMLLWRYKLTFVVINFYRWIVESIYTVHESQVIIVLL